MNKPSQIVPACVCVFVDSSLLDFLTDVDSLQREVCETFLLFCKGKNEYPVWIWIDLGILIFLESRINWPLGIFILSRRHTFWTPHFYIIFVSAAKPHAIFIRVPVNHGDNELVK